MKQRTDRELEIAERELTKGNQDFSRAVDHLKEKIGIEADQAEHLFERGDRVVDEFKHRVREGLEQVEGFVDRSKAHLSDSFKAADEIVDEVKATVDGSLSEADHMVNQLQAQVDDGIRSAYRL